MSILITGGSGLIGASLTQMIVELGERPGWGWKTSYSLPGMVDDFIEEFNQNRSLYL